MKKTIVILFLMFTAALKAGDKDVFSLFTAEKDYCVEQCESKECVRRCYEFYIAIIYSLVEDDNDK